MESIPLSAIPPQFPTTPPPLFPKKKSFTWLIIIVIIFLLAGSSVLAYKYFQLKQQVAQTQPSPTLLVLPASPEPTAEAETADWKTYKNKNYPFQFKYPQFYVETLDPEEKDIWFAFPGPPQVPAITININITPSKPNDTLSRYVEESLNYLRTQKLTEPNDFKITKTDEMQLGGEKAIKVNYQRTGLEQEVIYTIYANYRYSISRFSAGGKLERSEEFNQILSTFKFID